MRLRGVMWLPRPWENSVVAASPVPSMVRMAARSNGDTKNALAAWLM